MKTTTISDDSHSFEKVVESLLQALREEHRAHIRNLINAHRDHLYDIKKLLKNEKEEEPLETKGDNTTDNSNNALYECLASLSKDPVPP